MNILVINCGSSSFKYQLLRMDTESVLCSGIVERIGEGEGRLSHKVAPGTDQEQKFAENRSFKDHAEGMTAVFALLTDPEKGVLQSLEEISAVGHRVVLGGESLRESCVMGERQKALVRKMADLAPLHNPANLQGIEVAQRLLPHAPSVGVFDSEFHATLPPKAYMYAIPLSCYQEDKIRRYGFHGTSHRYVTRETARLMGIPLDKFNAISCHLGNGASITAVENGVSVDTSMGLTPLEGVVMGTRSGSIDPAILIHLGTHRNLGFGELDEMLNKQSGIKGICGLNDMRDIHDARESGNQEAQLAFEMLCYSIKKYVGAYFAVLGRVDALIFTAGIGENDEFVRSEVCRNMSLFGIVLDEEENLKRSPQARIISTGESRIPVFITPTNEELAIARETKRVLESGRS